MYGAIPGTSIKGHTQGQNDEFEKHKRDVQRACGYVVMGSSLGVEGREGGEGG